ncbi:MAG: AMP-binding protein [Nevskia sp.]|nr:AMP-binding protein [Nevskia sp.]
MRLIDFLDRAAAYWPQQCMLVQGGVQRSYAQVQDASHRIGRALQCAGVGAGGAAGFYTPNDWRAVEALYGTLRAGAAAVPVNSRNALRQNLELLDKAGARLLFYHSRYAQEAAAALAGCRALRAAVCLDGGDGAHPALSEWMAPAGARADEAAYRLEDPWALFGTSGTTGASKLVVQTHLTSMAFTVDMLFALRAYEGVRHLVVAPLTHFAGTFLFALSAVGSTHVLHDGVDVPEILAMIERERIEVLFLPPTVIYMMLDHPQVRRFDYASLKAFVYAGAPMAPARVRQAIEVFGPVMMNMFGQTEANGPIAFLRPEQHDPAAAAPGRIRSIGRAGLLRQVAIMADDGRLLGAGEPGEMVMRSWGNSAGYLGDPAASAELVRHGWMHTGDIGVQDAEGFVTLVDRKKDMIVSGGFNIFSAEVEEVLLSHPAVLGAAVIGVPDPKWGEAVKAVVQLKPGAAATADELVALCKSGLGGVKAPKSVEFWDALPRNATGKILKREIRNRFWQGQPRNI